MAASQSTILDEAQLFRQLEIYNWSKDSEYQSGLSAILGPNPSRSQLEYLTIRAQCYYFSHKKAVPINFDAYLAYLSHKYPERYPSTLIPPQEATMSNINLNSTNSQSPPSTQPQTTNSSTAQEQQQKATNQTSSLPIPTNATEKTAPYPPTFAEIVALITSGAPIPGIKDIPPTVLTSQGSKPTAARRRKPWEKNIPEDIIINGVGEGTFGDRRDDIIVQDFPDEDGVNGHASFGA